MELQVLKNNLKAALNTLKGATSKSSSLPVLDSVMLEAKNNHLELSATDLELGVKYKTLAKIKKSGKVVIPVQTFTSLVDSLPQETITLRSKKNDLNVKCKNYKSQLKGLDPEEFPIIPKVEEKKSNKIDSSYLVKGLEKVIGVTSISKTRPEISGVYTCFNKKDIVTVATDSFRLAEKRVSLDTNLDLKGCLIIPQKAAREIINIFSQFKQELKLNFSENQIMITSKSSEKTQPEIRAVSKLIEGNYPDYKEIVPEDYKTQLILSRDQFAKQVKTAGLFGGRVNEVKLNADPNKKKLKILSQDPNLGKNRSSLPAEIKGEPIEVSFNWRFLNDGLSSIETKKVIFELNGEGGAALLKPENDSSFIYVVMPIKG